MATLSSTGRFAAGETCADNDILYGPYATTAAAHAALLNAEQNVVGRTVGIQTGNTIEEYWYQGGTTEQDLVKKQSSDIEANPTGEATTPLNKIKIGETNYNIPQTDTSNLATKQELQQGLSGKQDIISDLQQIRTRANEGHTALQPKQSGQYTQGNIVVFDENGGLADSQKKTTDFATASQGTKADNAIPMPTGTDGQILEKDSNETSGVKWVNKPSDGQDGASAYELYEQAEIAAGRTPLSQEAWLASLKANIGEFLFVPTDAAAVTAMATIGQTYPSAIDPQGKNVAPTQNTLSVILLMNDDATTPSKTMMIVTQESATPGTYEFIYAGDLQSAMPSNVLTQANIVNNLNTGGATDVLSAEQGKEIGSTLYGEYGFADISPKITNESYYGYSSNKINVDKTVYGASVSTRISVTPGEKFKIFGKDDPNASMVRLWCFSDGTAVDGKYSAISVADNNTDARENGVVITAPEGSAYLSIAFYQYDSTKDKIQKWSKVVDGLVDKTKFGTGQSLNNVCIINNINTDSVNDVLSAKQGKLLGDILFDSYSWQLDMDDLSTQHYYNTNNNSIEYPPLSYANASCIRLSCVEGDKFKIFGKGNKGAVQLYVFTSIGNAIIEKPNSAIDSREDGIELTAPQNAAYLYINFYQYDSATDKVLRYAKDSIGLVTRVSDLETKSNSPLKGKNIVVFGDSLSEFKYQNKGWCDWAADISKANFINVAIGGTQIRQRRALITLFDATKTYNVGDWVYHKPSTQMNCYQCIVEHTGAFDDTHFQEVAYNYYIYSPLDIINLVKSVTNTNIVEYSDRFVNQVAAAECVKDHQGDNNDSIITRLISIDWSNVDAVVIMAGANDFNEKVYGTTSSTNINTTLGALNEIVRMINSTFLNIPIYWVTDTVRWFNYSSGTGSDADWCDVYISPNGGTLTYKEFFKAIVDEAVINHLPVIDLYKELGWNKWNFSNFFTDNDGTHPYKGFRQIAEKIVSFIIANKVF